MKEKSGLRSEYIAIYGQRTAGHLIRDLGKKELLIEIGKDPGVCMALERVDTEDQNCIA